MIFDWLARLFYTPPEQYESDLPPQATYTYKIETIVPGLTISNTVPVIDVNKRFNDFGKQKANEYKKRELLQKIEDKLRKKKNEPRTRSKRRTQSRNKNRH